MSVTSEATLVQTTNGARSALITRENLEDIALKGRDFAGMLKMLPGVIDTSAREAPGLGQHEQPRRSTAARRSTSPTTASPTRTPARTAATTPRPRSTRSPRSACRPRTSRPSTAAAPARRSRSSRAAASKDFRGSARVLQARRRVERQRVLAPPAVRTGRDRAVRAAALHVRQHRVDARRSRAHPGTGFNKGRNKLFFFWSQDLLSRTDPGTLNQRRMPTALERAGDFSQTFDSSEPPDLHPRSAALRHVQQPDRRAGVLRRQQDPGQPDRPDGAGAAEPVPAAERDRSDRHQPVQLHVPDRAGLAAQRPGAARGLERRAGHDRSTAACSSATRSARAACRSSARPARLAADADASTRSTRSATSTRCCTPSTRRLFAEFTVGVNWSHQYTSAVRPGGAGRQRSDEGAAGPAAVLPVGQPADNLLPQASFSGGAAGNDRVVQRRAAVPVLRLQHAVELLGQPDEDQGRAHHEDGLLRRAHDAARRSGRRASTAPELQHRRLRTRSTRTSASPTRCSAPSRSTRSPTATRRRTASS